MIRELLQAAIETLEANDPGQTVLLGHLREFRDGCNAAAAKVDALTDRQREIACLLAKGYSAPDTAAPLGLSKRTVETVRETVFLRLGIDSVAELAVMFYRAGLLGDAEG